MIERSGIRDRTLRNTHTDPDILALRALHVELDRVVLAAYSSKNHPTWSDIGVPPYTTPTNEAERKALERFEDEVIDRLFELNAERAEEEKLLGQREQKPKGKKPKGEEAQAKMVLQSPKTKSD